MPRNEFVVSFFAEFMSTVQTCGLMGLELAICQGELIESHGLNDPKNFRNYQAMSQQSSVQILLSRQMTWALPLGL